jgi:hypothetical protein
LQALKGHVGNPIEQGTPLYTDWRQQFYDDAVNISAVLVGMIENIEEVRVGQPSEQEHRN